uniref:Uncharacterized protein n=1 Tax=Arundo donax TaxID=35708 RepID=A0A0A9HAD9_ARUDO
MYTTGMGSRIAAYTVATSRHAGAKLCFAGGPVLFTGGDCRGGAVGQGHHRHHSGLAQGAPDLGARPERGRRRAPTAAVLR